MQVRGQFMGHFLSAMAFTSNATGACSSAPPVPCTLYTAILGFCSHSDVKGIY